MAVAASQGGRLGKPGNQSDAHRRRRWRFDVQYPGSHGGPMKNLVRRSVVRRNLVRRARLFGALSLKAIRVPVHAALRPISRQKAQAIDWRRDRHGQSQRGSVVGARLSRRAWPGSGQGLQRHVARDLAPGGRRRGDHQSDQLCRRGRPGQRRLRGRHETRGARN